MPEIAADPRSPSCSYLFSGPGIQVFQTLAPDLSSPRARDPRGRFAKGTSGNPRGRPPGIPNPRRRVPNLSVRPLKAQALTGLLDRKPHLLRPLAAQLLPPAARCHRPGGASRDRPVVIAHGRGCPAGACHRSRGHCWWRDHARRRCAHRAAGAHPVARDPAPRATGTSADEAGKGASIPGTAPTAT
jgi:hypothetical protein